MEDTALLIATEDDNIELIRLLVERGANVTEPNSRMIQPIHIANTISALSILVDAGADVNSLGENRDTPIFNQIYINEPYNISYLLAIGADPNIRNISGQTPLDVARELQRNEIIRVLEPVTNGGTQASDVVPEFQELSAPELPPFKMNIRKTITFKDPIMLTEEEVNLQEYINEDPDNVVIMYQNSERDTTNRYFLTKRSIITNQSKETSNVMFPCKRANDRVFVGIDDYHKIPLLSIKSIGFTTGNNYVDFLEFIRNPEHQLFAIYNLQLEFPSFVSKGVIQDGDVVSALHCQPGHASKVSKLYLGVASEEDNTLSLFEPLHASHSEELYTGGRRVTKKKHKILRKSAKNTKNKNSKKKTLHNKKKTRKQKKQNKKTRKNTHKIKRR